jgi:DNA repair exonuclease SbcCD ATPase subunit
MTPDERREEMGINAQIEILEENLEVEKEKVKDIEEEIARWRSEQRPSRQDSVPPFEAERLKRAKQRIAKIEERLDDFKAQLRDLHARVKARKQAEEAAVKARVEEIPKQAERIVDAVESIDPDDLEILSSLARAKKSAARLFNAREKLNQHQIEADYYRSKGHSIAEWREPTWPVCLDELRSEYRAASSVDYEPKRTAGTRKRTSEIGQMKGKLRDLAAEG